MKATVQSIALCLTLGLVGLHEPLQAFAGINDSASASSPQPTGNAQRDADAYLKAARQAIKDRKYDDADALITQAEKLNVKYDSLLSRFQDTPPRLRKLLVDEQAKDGASSGKPSSRFPVVFGGTKDDKSIPKDPVAGRPAAESAVARENVLGKMTDDNQVKAKSLLEMGRNALNSGNIPEAIAAYQKVMAVPATYSPSEYKPVDLANDLRAKGVDLQQIAAANRGPANTFSPGLMESPQADRIPGYANNNGPPPAAFGSQEPERASAAMQGQANSPAEYIAPRRSSSYPATEAAPLNLQPNVGPLANKAEALRLTAQAQAALDRGNVQEALRLAEQADALKVPDQAFAANETRPWQVLAMVNKAVTQRQGMALAGGTSAPGATNPIARGGYFPENDKTKNVKVQSENAIGGGRLQITPVGPPEGNAGNGEAAPAPPGASAMDLYQLGLKALEKQDRVTAVARFREAWRLKDQLDPSLHRPLGDKLSQLQAAAAPPQRLPTQGSNVGELPPPASPLDVVSSQQRINQERLAREIANEHKAAEELSQKDPRGALANLKKLRERVSSADVDNVARKQMLTLVDRYVRELEGYIEQNRANIDLRDQNERVRTDIDRSRDLKLESQNKLGQLVDQFNKLLDERRYAEAEVIAKQAKEIAPESAVTENMVWKSKFVRNYEMNKSISQQREDGFIQGLLDVEKAGIHNVSDENPLVYDAKRWGDLTRTRAAQIARQKQKLSPAEMEIQRALLKPVETKFENTALSEVLNTLANMTGVNMHLDPTGLGTEGVTSNTPVTLVLTQPISLRSALNLILEPLHLSYVIQNEVLRITSEQTRNSNVFAKVYYVADLVTPIPNFAPSYNIGIPGALRESLNSLGYGGGMRSGGGGPLTVAANDSQPAQGSPVQNVLAQLNGPMPLPGQGGTRGTVSPNAGPGGMGGGVQADFDSLIELITSTIQPNSWQDVGGPGSIEQFASNLSLVVSQTQEVHDQIGDLLEQLRKLQDLQVTIEVRFITLSDSFHERIGVDFDFNIDDNSGRFPGVNGLLPNQQLVGNPPNIISPDDSNRSFAVGINAAGFTPNLDFQFQQGGFGSTTPTFGAFDANSAANFGFAILSDIEVFLFLSATQGDNRTNVLQAPKVTLFNGQQAFVSDTSQRPFVTSVVPVVGDFAAAHQPVIVVLSEGTSLSVQAIVSPDRRFCRLTMVPFFSQIGNVDTFTFNGRVTTDTGTAARDPANPDRTVNNQAVRTVEGTTVQLPTFAFTTVATTVSVPDGGTVLLGGVKRLREGRAERGVPLLSKIPYVNRLFRNVGIGRDAQSLMMMVTPRIIIQEEEEAKLGISETPTQTTSVGTRR